MTKRTFKIEAAKLFFQRGLIDKEDYITILWEAGMLCYDEALEAICKANSDKRRGKVER